ncbi:hypothetical protein DM826_08060 [Halonotius aquaticus]|uniref:Uncharacterized protein n=1 Tax=Halonotius aquaticus TaxID=2216978 RepID=A0A3A6Q747_9EURY|nr:hypothetical protein DM826_08060 [Halonotius aquaticus]
MRVQDLEYQIMEFAKVAERGNFVIVMAVIILQVEYDRTLTTLVSLVEITVSNKAVKQCRGIQ